MEIELQEAAETTVPKDEHGVWRAFRHGNFKLFFWGQLISMIGTWSQTLALSWLVWRLTSSALWLGIINFAMQIPMLFLGLPGGVAADRYDRHRMLTLMQALCMLQALILAGLTLTGRIELWHVVLLSTTLGVVYAFEFPIRHAFVMDLVGKRDLLNANALASGMFHLTRMLGPTVAGIIVAWKGEGICFLFNAATFLFLIAALWRMDRSKILRVHHEPQPLIRSILEGLRHVRALQGVAAALLVVVLVSAIGMQYTTLLPMFADVVFGGGAVQLGWLMGASGAGSLLAAFLLARRRSQERLMTLASVSAIAFSVSLIAFGLTRWLLPSLGILFLMGLTLTLTFSCIGTFLQHRSPDHLRGRMMSLYSITFMGFGPFGSLLAGLAAREIGAPLTVAISGIICLPVGFWVLMRRKQSRQRTA